MLEAIELCICGGNRRQGGEQPSGARLRIQFLGQNQPQRCPETDLVGYRLRDRAWYGGYYRTGNQLCHNFGRFNFFDSDAAFQLSLTKSGEKIVHIINGMLLGDLATTIEERMKQFQVRFTREERQIKQLVMVHRQEARNASEQIEQLKAIKDTREVLLRELQSKAERCGWQKLPTRFKLDDLALLKEAVEDVMAQVSQHVERLPWLARVSIGSLRREATQFGVALTEIARQNDLAKKNSAASERIKNQVIEVEAELSILRRLSEYHREPNALSLLGTSAAIKETKTKVAQMKEALNLLRTVDLSKFEECTGTLDEIAAQQEGEMTKQRRSLAKLKLRATELQTQLGTIKTVVEEIKGLGRRFCEISPHSTDCPLCGANYDQLSSRIRSLEFSAPAESALRELTIEVAREQAKLAELQSAADTLALVRLAAQAVFSTAQLASRSTKSVVEKLELLGEQLAGEKTQLDELTAKEKRLKLAGFEEVELRELFEVAQETHSLSRSKLANKAAVLAHVVEKTETLGALRKGAREKEKAQKEIEAEVRRIVRGALGDVPVEESGVELERRKMLVEEALAEATHAQRSVSISDSEEFSSVENKLDTFARAVGRIQQALKSVEEKDALEQRLAANLAEAQRKLIKLEPSHTRAKTALTVLERLLGSDYKAAYLQQVIRDHKEKLSTIFSRVHAPHEFKGVDIDTNVLLERRTGVKSAVSEISTGQRAALALSLFLSLNSSVSKRAPWLLFDDPVAYVDDLNILSFLDMLRDLVLLGDRQVFFATANTRIADLFAKKFDFLGTEFRDFQFRR